MHSCMATAQEFIKNMPNFVGYSTYLPIYNLIRITIPSIKHPNISKYLDFSLSSLGRLLRHNIVHFHLACVRTEIFSPYLLHSKTLNTIPKSSRSVDPQYFFNGHLYFHSFAKQHSITRHFEFCITSAQVLLSYLQLFQFVTALRFSSMFFVEINMAKWIKAVIVVTAFV